MRTSSVTGAAAPSPSRAVASPFAARQQRQELITLQRALEGDGQAFAALVSPHLARLHRVAQRACGDPVLAEDAVQEALTLVYERLARYRPGTSFKAFVTAIAVKRAHSLMRSERRRRDRERASARPATWAAADARLDAERAAVRVREALAAMPEKRREVAILRLDGGLSYAEIAEATGTTAGSARVLVHKAVKQLRGLLADVLGDRAAQGGER